MIPRCAKAVSFAGAACHSEGIDVSEVLKAIGLPLEWAKGTIRFSTGRLTTLQEIEKSIEVVLSALKRLAAVHHSATINR